MRVAQATLSQAAGRAVSFEAIACLYGTSLASPLRRDHCAEALGALTAALQTMVTWDPSTRGLELDLLRDWRKQVERLGEIAPSVFPLLLAHSVSALTPDCRHPRPASRIPDVASPFARVRRPRHSEAFSAIP